MFPFRVNDFRQTLAPLFKKLFHMSVSGLQVIYDLLERSSGHLELREDPDQGITVAGLKRIKVFLVISKSILSFHSFCLTMYVYIL